jgi:hypothetical protein
VFRLQAPIGITVDHRFQITWMTPEVSRLTGNRVGMHAGYSPKIPWLILRRCLQAMERSIDSVHPVVWGEPGVDGGIFACIGQAFPLPLKRGLFVTSWDLIQVPGPMLREALAQASGEDMRSGGLDLDAVLAIRGGDAITGDASASPVAQPDPRLVLATH